MRPLLLKNKRGERLDWRDREAVEQWWHALVESIEDVMQVASDATRPLRKRKLGPASARKLFRDAENSVRSLLSYGEPTLSPDIGDPAGTGGAGPAEH